MARECFHFHTARHVISVGNNRIAAMFFQNTREPDPDASHLLGQSVIAIPADMRKSEPISVDEAVWEAPGAYRLKVQFGTSGIVLDPILSTESVESLQEQPSVSSQDLKSIQIGSITSPPSQRTSERAMGAVTVDPQGSAEQEKTTVRGESKEGDS